LRSSAASLTPLWTSWAITVAIMALLRPFGADESSVGEYAVMGHLLVALLVLMTTQRQSVAAILTLSLILRSAMVFWDLNFTHPFSGADSDVYYYWAVRVSEDLSLTLSDIQGGTFSKLFGWLFWLTGPSRAFGQYTNALLGLSLVLVVQATLRRISLERRQAFPILALAALLPNSLLLSAIFLRETTIALLVALSLYFLVRWFLGGSSVNILAVAAAVLAASSLHAGVIAVGIGYAAVILFYSPRLGRVGLDLSGLVYLAVFVALIYLAVRQYPDLFLGKFEQFETEQDIITSANARRGESAYLAGLTVTSLHELVLYSPIRTLYFIGSPMPWDFRGAPDILSFLADSIFYIAGLLFAVRNFRHLAERKYLVVAILIVIGIATLVFGAGVSNAGTAMRHRFKLFSLFIVLAGAAQRQPAMAATSPSLVAHSSRHRPGDERRQLFAGIPNLRIDSLDANRPVRRRCTEGHQHD